MILNEANDVIYRSVPEGIYDEVHSKVDRKIIFSVKDQICQPVYLTRDPDYLYVPTISSELIENILWNLQQS